MLEQSSVELENTISNLEEKNDNIEDEGNLLLHHDPTNSQSGEYDRIQQDLVHVMFMTEEKEAYFLKTCVSICCGL